MNHFCFEWKGREQNSYHCYDLKINLLKHVQEYSLAIHVHIGICSAM